MKANVKCFAAGMAAAFFLAGCSWVDLTPAAEKVRVLEPQEVASCREVGRVVAKTKAKIGFIARSRDTVDEEVERLARNNAADLGGDTLVPSGPLVDGERSFKVYRCINP